MMIRNRMTRIALIVASFASGLVVTSTVRADHDYEVLRIKQMPKQVEVHIVKSDQPPTGVGEPATPVIAPAVANALFSVTGKRYYELPIKIS